MTLVHPDDYSRTMDSMHIYLSGKTEKYESEYRILTNSGEYRWFYDVGTIGKKDLAGSPVSLTGLVEDITERKNIEEEIRILNMHLEQKVNERTSQLLQANKELEAFSYSVSHDLRAPLRAIIGFTNILQEEHEDALNAEGKRICNVIHSSAWKLGKLIDDLLSFSRLSRGELQIAKINMEKLVHTIFMDLTSAEERSRILFKVEKLPTSSGDGAMIKQAWINLISNAIKYTSRNQSAIIEIGSTKQNMETIYFIRDNGIGFDMLYSDKLFGVFQRLHGSREFEGNGVGLAIVQRIIQKHGGRVWAEGKVNEGAIFYLTIPNSIKDE
jgi:light-regulated signal transduction histidine kinase (bacteriophytochrome)